MAEYTVEPLGPDTWDAFARLVERHNGVWGGCWCLWFHPESPERGQSLEGNRALKQRLVNEGQAHAALVFDGDRAVGWCQYGSPEELPGIYHRKEYEAGLVEPPDYRLTCFFVDRDYRREGVSAVALRGALDLIAEAGGGLVEGYPQDTQGKKVSASFLYNGTRSLFEQAGFEYERPKGKNLTRKRSGEGAARPAALHRYRAASCLLRRARRGNLIRLPTCGSMRQVGSAAPLSRSASGLGESRRQLWWADHSPSW